MTCGTRALVCVVVRVEGVIRIWSVRNEEFVGFHHAVASYFVLHNS